MMHSPLRALTHPTKFLKIICVGAVEMMHSPLRALTQ